MSQRRALGKGLDAIFANLGTEVQDPKTGATVHEVELGRISPNPFQPRLEFVDEELQELADSIALNGLIQPIFLRKHAGGYQIVSGERRFRAFQRLKRAHIPALVRDAVSDRDMRELAIVENIQRVQLNAIEEALAFEQLANETGLTHEEIAQRVGKSRAAVTNTLRLLKLEPQVRQWISEGKLTAGHGRALLPLEGAAQVKQARALVEGGLNVREAEKAQGRREGAGLKPTPTIDPNTRAFLDDLRGLVGMKVAVRGAGKKGVLEIHYSNRDELDNLIETLRRGAAQ